MEAAYLTSSRPAGRAPCGTTGAYRRHIRNREQPCPACRAAQQDYKAARAAGMRAESAPDTRAVRNGLPEFVPYIWKGQGR